MGFSKLREWVGTVTGKGVRWGRDRVGRSAPAFMAASTTALPLLPARREADFIIRQLLFLLRSRPTVGRSFVLRPVPGGESAGCVRLQCLFCRLCLPAANFACHAHCPHQVLAPVQLLCPRSFCFALPLFFPCAPGSTSPNQHVCKLRDWRPCLALIDNVLRSQFFSLG